MERFCQMLPKLELHAHLNGSLSDATLISLHEMQKGAGDNLPWSRCQTVIDHGDKRSLQECFELFNVAHSLTTTSLAVSKATRDVIKEFADDGVVYLELRSTPRDIPGEMSKFRYIKAIVDGIQECINVHNITVKLLISMNRKHGKVAAEEILQAAIEAYEHFPNTVVGIDLSGNPSEGNIDDYLPLLDEARRKGLKITIHVAEIPNTLEIKSILDFKPDRLGHATCIHPLYGGSKGTWELLLKSQIPVELCLTSNVKTRTIDSYENHHFKHLFESRHPISLGTDDKGVFATTLSQEYLHAASTFSLTKEQLWQLSAGTIGQAFISEQESRMLTKLLMDQKQLLLSTQ